MIGDDAFCPKTGAPLSEETHYDEENRRRHVVLPDENSLASQSVGELTHGALRSSKAALFNRFRRCHRRHHEVDDALYRKAALALSRLKRTATGCEQEDIYVWYALQRRLTVAGYETEWMDVHVEPHCPHCHGRLKYEPYDTGDVYATCGTDCTESRANHLPELRETIADLYARAFDDPVTADDFLQF